MKVCEGKLQQTQARQKRWYTADCVRHCPGKPKGELYLGRCVIRWRKPCPYLVLVLSSRGDPSCGNQGMVHRGSHSPLRSCLENCRTGGQPGPLQSLCSNRVLATSSTYRLTGHVKKINKNPEGFAFKKNKLRRLVGWLVGWLAGWLAGWLVGWLLAWLVGGLSWVGLCSVHKKDGRAKRQNQK